MCIYICNMYTHCCIESITVYWFISCSYQNFNEELLVGSASKSPGISRHHSGSWGRVCAPRSGDAMAVSWGRCKMNSLEWKILLKWMIKMDNPPTHPKLDHFSIETYCMVLEIHCRKPQCITVKCYMKHLFHGMLFGEFAWEFKK